LAHEARPPPRIRLQQALLGALEHEAQPVQIVPATASPQRDPEPPADELAHDLPVPVRQVEACLPRRRLDRCLQPGLLPPVEGGGEPPVCSKANAAGPFRPNAASHSPIVCGSRSSASATWAADQPRATSQSACHRSRSRGVGARYMRSRAWRASKCHCSNNPSIAEPRRVLPSRRAYRGDPAAFTLALV